MTWYSSPTNEAVDAVQTIAPPAALGHCPRSRRRHQVHPAGIHVHRAVEVLERRLQSVLEVRHAGVRGQDVEAAEALDRLGDGALGGLGLADVGGKSGGARPQLGERRLQIVAVIRRRDEDEPGALGDEPLGDRAADPARSPGDDPDLALEPHAAASRACVNASCALPVRMP